jgi:hypothetical protein
VTLADRRTLHVPEAVAQRIDAISRATGTLRQTVADAAVLRAVEHAEQAIARRDAIVSDGVLHLRSARTGGRKPRGHISTSAENLADLRAEAHRRGLSLAAVADERINRHLDRLGAP